MADNYANLSALQRLWQNIKAYIDGALGLKLDADSYATDTAYGIVKTNSAESVTLNADGQLDVGGRLGQMPNTTGVFSPKTISPNVVNDGSLLLTEASGTFLGSKSLAVSTGTNITCRSAAAGSTVYRVTNTYVNRLSCSVLLVADAVAALNEDDAKAGNYARVLSVQRGGAAYVPDSSPNSTAQEDDIVITLEKSINPNAATTSLRVYPAEKNFSNLYVGQAVGGNGGASVVVGQRVMSYSGNANALIGADIYNQGNGNAIFGRQHISRKNRWFMAGSGHDNTSGRSEAGAAFGQYSLIDANTLFAVGNGTSHVARANAFEIKADGRVKASGTPTDNDDLATKAYVDSAIGGGGLAVQTFGHADFTYQQVLDPETQEVVNECVAYSTTAGSAEEPKAVKYGRVVNMTGAFKNINVRPDTGTFVMGKVPAGCEPLYRQCILVQGTSQAKFLLTIETDGTLKCARYSTGASAIAVPNNAWMNLNATYISAS